MKWRIAVVATMATLTMALPAGAASLPLAQGGSIYKVQLRPLTDMRFENVVRQQYDLSCGAAAVATIFQHFYGANFSEDEIIKALLKTGDAKEISKRGFSMLEIKRYAESHGFVSEGFRITDVTKLRELKAPVLTLINTRGYKHFVVLKKVRGDSVILADPAFGNTVKTLDEFEKLWNKVVLVVLSPDKNGRSAFIEDYSVSARAKDVTLLLPRGLQSITGGRSEF